MWFKHGLICTGVLKYSMAVPKLSAAEMVVVGDMQKVGKIAVAVARHRLLAARDR